jgi:hypothetical protein
MRVIFARPARERGARIPDLEDDVDVAHALLHQPLGFGPAKHGEGEKVQEGEDEWRGKEEEGRGRGRGRGVEVLQQAVRGGVGAHMWPGNQLTKLLAAGEGAECAAEDRWRRMRCGRASRNEAAIM